MKAALVTVLSAVLLGPLDLLLQHTLPYPWANLANSPAVWAVAAFALGRYLRLSPARAAIAGALQLLIAVQAYNVADVLAGADPFVLRTPATMVWLVLGLLGGLLFGAAGTLSRRGAGWLSAVAAGLPVAVLLAEAAQLVRRADDSDAHYRNDSLQTAAIEAVLGLLLLFLLARGGTNLLRTVVAVAVLTAAGFAAFVVLTGISL